jgi:thymidylate synthase
MRQYLDLLEDVLKHGTRQSNRTGTDAISLPGAMLKFDLAEGFPAVTTKKLAFKSVAAELVGFLRGYDNAADFRALGSRIWDQNANENPQWLNNPHRKGEDDLGRIYGVQWRRWRGANGQHVDQVMQALRTLRERPNDRRIIISAWKPDELIEMALPPCHISYQFLVNAERGELHLCMYQRSCDLFLGVPFNIASSALFLSLMARLTGYRPGRFTHFLADAHIYVNHVEQVEEQLSRAPLPLPQLEIDERIPAFDGIHFEPEWIDKVEPGDFRLKNYVCHPALRAPMAV